MKPIIGLVPLVDDERDSYWMLPGYMHGIEHAGGIPIMLPLTNDKNSISRLIDTADGFLFTGGHDVSPSLYGEVKLPECGIDCPIRDNMESILFKLCLLRDKPVLGICRGIQFINAALGGTLYQDIPAQFPSDLIHHQAPPYDVPSHKVTITENSPLYNTLKKTVLSVNSYHHQGIKRLSDSLCAMAFAEDGLTEAVYMPKKNFVWGVQWHPEFSFHNNEDSLKIFKSFTDACFKSHNTY